MEKEERVTLDTLTRSIFPPSPTSYVLTYGSVDEVAKGAADGLDQIQDLTQDHLARAALFVLFRADKARRGGPAEAYAHVLSTIDDLLQPLMKSETSLLISSALRLVVYNQCATLSNLYRDVPGREMASEQPRVVVAHHRHRLEWVILGTVLEMAPAVLTEKSSLIDWLLIGVRLKFLATKLLADAEAMPTAARSDAVLLLKFCKEKLTILETHLREYGLRAPPLREPREESERRFEEFVHLLLADKAVDTEKKWRNEAIRVQEILMPRAGKKDDDDPTASVDEDAMALESRLREKKK